MHVRLNSRKEGVGRKLVETVLNIARQRVEPIQLSMVSKNEPAKQHNSDLGFLEFGMEKKALKQDG